MKGREWTADVIVWGIVGDRLPAEYKALEARVDALNDLHKGMLKYVLSISTYRALVYPLDLGMQDHQGP